MQKNKCRLRRRLGIPAFLLLANPRFALLILLRRIFARYIDAEKQMSPSAPLGDTCFSFTRKSALRAPHPASQDICSLYRYRKPNIAFGAAWDLPALPLLANPRFVLLILLRRIFARYIDTENQISPSALLGIYLLFLYSQIRASCSSSCFAGYLLVI